MNTLFCFDCLKPKAICLFAPKQVSSTRPVCRECISKGNKLRRVRSAGSGGKKSTWRLTMGTHFLRSSR